MSLKFPSKNTRIFRYKAWSPFAPIQLDSLQILEWRNKNVGKSLKANQMGGAEIEERDLGKIKVEIQDHMER